MKKILFFSALFLSSLSVHAQLKVASTGKVSIGTTASPASKLSIGAAGHSNYAAYIDGNTKITGKLHTTVVSNRELDGHYTICNMTNMLSRVCQLSPQYAIIGIGPIEGLRGEDTPDLLPPNLPGELDYGINGAAVNDVFPCVTYRDESLTYLIDHGKLQMVLIQAIKELAAKVETLEHQVDSLINVGAAASRANSNSFDEEYSETTSINIPATSTIKLYQNTPNPFSERTTIRFTLPEGTQNAYIYIFDMQGKLQKQIPVDASMQNITLNGYELSAGMYIYSLVVNGKEIDTKRMILSR